MPTTPLILVRPPSPRLAEGELTHLDRSPIDVDVARREHAAYERALEGLGFRVTRLAPADDQPDSVFIEDAAVVISTHLIADVEQVLDEVIFLREGCVMLQEKVETIRDEKGKSVDELFREVFRC